MSAVLVSPDIMFKGFIIYSIQIDPQNAHHILDSILYAVASQPRREPIPKIVLGVI